MADAIFDAAGNVAGNGGGGLQAWSGAGALASILPSATGGISTSLPALLSGDNELTRTARSLPRYTYPAAKKVDYNGMADLINQANSARKLSEQVEALKNKVDNMQNQGAVGGRYRITYDDNNVATLTPYENPYYTREQLNNYINTGTSGNAWVDSFFDYAKGLRFG